MFVRLFVCLVGWLFVYISGSSGFISLISGVCLFVWVRIYMHQTEGRWKRGEERREGDDETGCCGCVLSDRRGDDSSYISACRIDRVVDRVLRVFSQYRVLASFVSLVVRHSRGEDRPGVRSAQDLDAGAR